MKFDITSSDVEDIAQALTGWAMNHHIEKVVPLRPIVGILSDQWDRIREALAEAAIELHGLRREREVSVMDKETAGFFCFWKKTAGLRGN